MTPPLKKNEGINSGSSAYLFAESVHFFALAVGKGEGKGSFPVKKVSFGDISQWTGNEVIAVLLSHFKE